MIQQPGWMDMRQTFTLAGILHQGFFLRMSRAALSPAFHRERGMVMQQVDGAAEKEHPGG